MPRRSGSSTPSSSPWLFSPPPAAGSATTTATVGPLTAGLLTEAVDWRAMFALQVAVGVTVALIGWRKVENRPEGEPQPFDLTGLVVLMVGLAAVLVSMMQALAWGWDAPATT